MISIRKQFADGTILERRASSTTMEQRTVRPDGSGSDWTPEPTRSADYIRRHNLSPTRILEALRDRHGWTEVRHGENSDRAEAHDEGRRHDGRTEARLGA